MKSLFNVTAVALMSLTLAACGGGGGSDSSGGGSGNGGGTVTPPFTVSVTKVGDLSEGQSATLRLTLSNAKSQVTTSVQATAGVTVQKVSDTEFTITAPNVDRDLTSEITWTAQDGTNTTGAKTGKETITIANTSFIEGLATVETWLNNQDRLIGFTEEKALLSALSDVAAVLGEAQVQASQVDAQDISTFETAMSELSAVLSAYKSKTASDGQVEDAYNAAKAEFEKTSAPYKNALRAALAVLVNDGKPAVSLGDYFVNAELGSVSMITGNPELGSVQDGKWVFAETVTHLDGLINNTECSL